MIEALVYVFLAGLVVSFYLSNKDKVDETKNKLKDL